MIRSSVLLAASLGLWSCSGDQLADEAGVPTAIIATPTVAFVTQGETKLIKFGLVDELGGLIPSSWAIGASPAEFTVTFDSTFRVVYNSDGTLTLPDNQSEVRATITALSAGSGSFTVSASGVSLDVPISILPANVPATFNTTTPQIGEDLVLTMPAGLTLLADATYSAGDAAPPIVVSQASDGSSVTLLVAPGTASPITIAGVTPDFADLNLTLNTTETITATNTSLYVGTDDPSTAPEITLPAVGSVSFYDIPYTVDQFYKVVLTVPTTLKLTTDWADHGADLDQLWMNAAFAVIPPFTAATSAAPEVSTAVYAAGTYYFFADQYDGDPGDWYKFTIEVVPQP
jgi:hypothetical protein